jgi:hypothetical protein
VAMLVAVLDETRDLHENQQDNDNEQRNRSHNITEQKVQANRDKKQ